jgi:hypothetical protein
MNTKKSTMENGNRDAGLFILPINLNFPRAFSSLGLLAGSGYNRAHQQRNHVDQLNNGDPV